MIEPERSLIPPPEPEFRWSDWSAPAVVSVSARTPEEAQDRVKEIVKRFNLFLGSDPIHGGILELERESALPEPS